MSIEPGDEQHRAWWEQAKKQLANPPESIDIDDYLNSPPHNLLAWRSVRHHYVDRFPASFAGAKIIRSLGFQMRASVQDLAEELRAQGRDYDLLLKGGFWGNRDGRWELLLNGERFALIDRDYGFDCFDVSSTQFKDEIAELIEQAEQKSKIHPLSERERKELDARLMSEPLEWGRLCPDERHAIGLGEDYLKRFAHRPKAKEAPRVERVELQKFVDKHFKSPLIKQHLRNQEIDARTQALLVFTTDAPLISKRYAFMELIEEEKRTAEKLRSEEKSLSSEHEETALKLRECEEAMPVFATYLELIENAIRDLLYWLDDSAGDEQDADKRREEVIGWQRCVLCTYFKHDERYELDGTIGAGEQFKEVGRLKISCEMEVPDPAPFSDESFGPSLMFANRDKLTFGRYMPWDADQPYPKNKADLGSQLDAYDGLVGYSGRKSALSFFSSDSLGEFVFGPEDEHLNSLKSLFVGVFEQGMILTLDFEPFYRRREGVVLRPSYRGEDSEEEYVISEILLTKVGTRWTCAELAGRFFFGGIDPLGPYFNSYAAVKESGGHRETHEMIALEALIGTFLYWTECAGAEDLEAFSAEDAAEEAEFYILEAVQAKLAEDPTLADRIICAFDQSPQFGLTDEELLDLCGIDV